MFAPLPIKHQPVVVHKSMRFESLFSLRPPRASKPSRAVRESIKNRRCVCAAARRAGQSIEVAVKMPEGRFALVLLLLVVCDAVWGQNVADNEILARREKQKQTKSPAETLSDEVDILRLMNVSAKDQGVSQVEGPIKNFPAYKFRLPYGNVPLTNGSLVTAALNANNGFTVIFLYRQQKNNLGTLLSINSPGRLTPWLQLSTSSKLGTLNMRYRTKDSPKLRQIEWPLPKHHRKSPLAAWVWMSLGVNYKDGKIHLDLDCQPSRTENIASKSVKNRISIPDDALVYFRQEPGRKKKFLGSMQVAKILPYPTPSRSWSCIEISDKLPHNIVKPIP